jgi:hypothetical protein
MKKLPLSVCMLVKDSVTYLSNAVESVIDIAEEVIIINSPPGPLSPGLGASKEGEEESGLRFDLSNLFKSPLLPLEPINNSLDRADKTTDLSRVKSGFRGEFKRFEFPWNNDFSEVRNFALEKAIQPWVLILDSDQFLEKEIKEKISACLEKDEIDLFYLKYKQNILTFDEQIPYTTDNEIPTDFLEKISTTDLDETSYQYLRPYLFRNNIGIKFSGRVFEKITEIEKLSGKTEIADIYIYHFINSKKQKEETKKRERYLLEYSLKNDLPQNIFYQSIFLEFKIQEGKKANQFLNFKKKEMDSTGSQKTDSVLTAIQELERNCLKNNNYLKNEILKFNSFLDSQAKNIDINMFHNWYIKSTGFLLNDLKDYENVFIILNKILNDFNDSVELLFILFNMYFKLGMVPENIKVLNYSVNLLREKKNLLKTDAFIKTRLLDPDYYYNLLMVGNYEIGNFEAFEYYFKQIKNQDFYRKQYDEIIYMQTSYQSQLKHLESEVLINNTDFINFRLAREYLKELNYDKAYETYMVALEKAGENKNKLLLDLLCNDLLANAKALLFNEKSIAELITSTEKNRTFYYSLGRYCLNTGNPKQALEAFKLAKKVKDIESPKLINYFYHILATYYLSIGNQKPDNDPFYKAKLPPYELPGYGGFNEKILSFSGEQFLLKQIENYIGLAELGTSFLFINNNNLSEAVSHFKNKDFEKALELFLAQGGQFTDDRNNDYEKFIIYDYISLIYERLEDYHNAEIYAESAFNVFPEESLKIRMQTDYSKKYWKIVNNLPDGIIMGQVKSEWSDCLKEIDKIKPDIVVEIGTLKGGTMYTMSELCRDTATLISIDLPGGDFGGSYVTEEDFIRLENAINTNKPYQKFYSLREDSHRHSTLIKLQEILNGRKTDVLFIDGDHTYEGVKLDYNMYSPLVADNGIIIFHDILQAPTEPACQVDIFWEEIKQKNITREFIRSKDQGWAGIGVIYNKRSA